MALVIVKHILTKLNSADMFTKPLDYKTFAMHRAEVMNLPAKAPRAMLKRRFGGTPFRMGGGLRSGPTLGPAGRSRASVSVRGRGTVACAAEVSQPGEALSRCF